MLLNIVNRPSEEFFLHGFQQAKDFALLKKQCFLGWTTVAACVRIWTVPYTSEKLALLLVLRDQVNSAKKVRVSPRAGVMPQMTDLKRAMCDLSDSVLSGRVSFGYSTLASEKKASEK